MDLKIADARCGSTAGLADLETLVVRCLTHDRRVDVFGFVEGLLNLIPELHSVQAAFEEPDLIRFEAGKGGILRIPIESARPKLRMVCARLGVVSGDRAGKELDLYGDRVEFPHVLPDGGAIRFGLDFQNMPGSEGFLLESMG